MRIASEVKGVWFVSARRFLAESDQEDVAARIIARLEPPDRDAFENPHASAWYPETALANTLGVLREETHRERDDRFVALMESITLVGVSRFFKVVLGVASPDFVIRKIPVMWSHVRRGAGKVAVTTDGRGAQIRYSEFPWFSDENYRLLTVGSIHALVSATGTPSDVSIAEASDDALTIDVVYRTRPRSVPPPRG